MKIEVDEYGSFIIISINDNKCLCEIEDFLHDDSNFIDDTGYMHVWNKICRDIFGSWFIRSKNIIAESYAIFYDITKSIVREPLVTGRGFIRVSGDRYMNIFHYFYFRTV